MSDIKDHLVIVDNPASYTTSSVKDRPLDEELFTSVSGRVVSERTKILYGRYVKTLHKRFGLIHPEGHLRPAHPIDLVSTLLMQAHLLRPKTFGSYRSGLVYWLNTLSDDDPSVQHALRKLNTECPHDGYKGHKPDRTATRYSQRSMRSRTFSRKNFDKLKARLVKRSERLNDARVSRRSEELLLWLQAGLASGLRPAEWETAQWQDIERGELLVQTAKLKLSYAFPSIKHLTPPKENKRIVQIDKDSISLVNQHMLAVRRHLDTGSSFKKYYDNNRNYLLETCIEIFGSSGPRLSLYTMRGQFAANKKKAGFSLETVGREMGCSWHVASVNYGNKSAGHRGKGIDDRMTEDVKYVSNPDTPPLAG